MNARLSPTSPVSRPAPPRVHFGPFHLDRASGELYRRGAKIRLQAKPCRVLEVLLERPGEVVTRAELQARLWATDTFVDFEHGLNSAVRRLRRVLGDSARKPRFVETLAGRGYRFIGPAPVVDAVGESSSSSARLVATPAPRRAGRPWAAWLLAVVSALSTTVRPRLD